MFFTKLWQSAAHGGRWFFMNTTVITAVVWSAGWYGIDSRLTAKTKTCSDVWKRRGVDVGENMRKITTFVFLIRWTWTFLGPCSLFPRHHGSDLQPGARASRTLVVEGTGLVFKGALCFWSHFVTLYLFTERFRRLNRELGASQTLDSALCWFCLYTDSMFDLGKWTPPFSLSVEYLQSWL